MKRTDIRHTGSRESRLQEIPFVRTGGNPRFYISCGNALPNHGNGINRMRFQVSGSPEFHALYWETLKGSDLSHSWTMQALMVRENFRPRFVKAIISLKGIREKDFDPQEVENLLKILLNYEPPPSAFGSPPPFAEADTSEIREMLPSLLSGGTAVPYPEDRRSVLADMRMPEPRPNPPGVHRDGEGGKDIRYFLLNAAYGFAIFQVFDLDARMLDLLTCLAPFTSVVATGKFLDRYVEKLKKQPELAHLSFDRMEEAIREADRWGLISPHSKFPAFLKIQPVFSYFLRARLESPERAGVRRAVEAAFLEHYAELDREITELVLSKERRRKELGARIAEMELDNLAAATALAVDARISVLETARTLLGYMDTARTDERIAAFGKMLLEKLEACPPERLNDEKGADMVLLTDQLGKCQMRLGNYADAENAFRKSLSMLRKLDVLDEKQKTGLSTLLLRNLGKAAERQGKWRQAERCYRRVIEVYAEFNDPREQAMTAYHLGRVLARQRRWESARDHLLRALELFAIHCDFRCQSLTLKNLFWLWKSAGDPTLPAAVADVLGWRVESVERLFAIRQMAS